MFKNLEISELKSSKINDIKKIKNQNSLNEIKQNQIIKEKKNEKINIQYNTNKIISPKIQINNVNKKSPFYKNASFK